MIKLITINHSYTYDLSDIIKMYFGKEVIEFYECKALEECQSFFEVDNIVLISSLEETDKDIICYSRLITEKRMTEHPSFSMLQHTEASPKAEVEDIAKLTKKVLKRSMYKLLSSHYKKEFPWGILTGIRPIKLVHELLDKGADECNIIKELTSSYLISKERAELALDISDIERQYIMDVDDKRLSIYVGIPFCPTRCHYCSFTSNSIKTCGAYVKDYIDRLVLEISEVSKYLHDIGTSVETVYIGGGTPTSISAEQLKQLIDCINTCFGGSYTEFTCEAGRPDTIDREKLTVLKEGGITRLSINPQTMNDSTLEAVGRGHNSEQIVESFKLARELGFDNINMDIILGLPGEGIEELKYTLDKLKELNPDSITVHTMAIKRASILIEQEHKNILTKNPAEEMMEYTMAFMQKIDMKPYYLYRQKHMLHNMENIGFCKSGKECIYNIQIIEERQSNVAFGADAVTKAVFPKENRIERQHNIKDLRLYIARTEEMVEDKLKLLKELWQP